MAEENLPAPISRLIQLRHTIAQPVFAAFLAGGVAGAVSRTVVSPLERLKILFQIQSAGRTGYKLPIGQGLMKMWRDEGWRGLMRGNGANCIRIIPYSAVQFASYNFYQKTLGMNQGEKPPPWKNLLCGAFAGITSVTFTYPLDIIRTRLSVQTADFATLSEAQRKDLPGMWRTGVNIYTTEGGFLALYGGYVPTIAGVAPYVGLNFMTYEFLRIALTPEGQKNPSSYGKLLAGAISGAVAQTCTYPLDVLRRRFQINKMKSMGYKYKSIWDAVKIIGAEEGIRGFYKGLVPNLLKVAPSMASSFLSFELARDFLVSLGDDDA
ncbi:hypothetical protein JMJ35_002636 [Cladonia borealis]|uniref:Mitochondrial thiamine pyrophosphate carrier 1 n=1 Tax=Cladonia borealis TaxID=184061 RepID=A0AA39R5F7_9LECA|nr:hypothetical protein JMJ35_002636 [Cladonia borealis]